MLSRSRESIINKLVCQPHVCLDSLMPRILPLQAMGHVLSYLYRVKYRLHRVNRFASSQHMLVRAE